MRGRLAYLLAMTVLALPGCVRIPLPQPPAVQAPPAGTNTIRLHVLRDLSGSVLALVPISINGKGPYQFALDTGASKSVIDRSVAKALDLPVVGHADTLSGVVTTGRADLVSVANWRLGSIALPKATVAALEFSGAMGPRGAGGVGLQGLLGSDILSRFGAITIDYEKQVLTIRPRNHGQ